MTKSAVFGVMHLGIAFAVAYALTGSLTISGMLMLVEPLCNTVAHYFFDKYWDHPRARALRERIGRRLAPVLQLLSRRLPEPAASR